MPLASTTPAGTPSRTGPKRDPRSRSSRSSLVSVPDDALEERTQFAEREFLVPLEEDPGHVGGQAEDCGLLGQ